MRCTLPVNAGACSSQRRVSAGAFTNRACATNRNHSESFIVVEGDSPYIFLTNNNIRINYKKDFPYQIIPLMYRMLLVILPPECFT